MLTKHALTRLSDRLTSEEVAYYRAVADAASRRWPTGDVAVRLGRLPEYRGSRAWQEGPVESNGDEVWAVIRSGRVVTTMLRNSGQCRRPECFRVDRVEVL